MADHAELPRTSDTARRRLSSTTSFARRAPPPSSSLPTIAEALTHITTIANAVVERFLALPPRHRLLAAAAAGALVCIGVVALVFSHAIFNVVAGIAAGWRAIPGGWVFVWLIIAATAFPPIIGYSSASTLAGFVFGVARGWPIAASATVLGSLASFMASRTVLSGYVDRLVGRDRRFVALSQVLRHDGIFILTLIRFCPLPYSLSNGFLATVPSVSPLSFAIGTALSSPKLFVHVFIGSRLARIAEGGDSMSAGEKAINYLSMLVGLVVGGVVGMLIYRRTMARAAELAREEGPFLDAERRALSSSSVSSSSSSVASGGGDRRHRGAGKQVGASAVGSEDYADVEAALMDPEDAAALMDGDDVSLWDVPGAGAGGFKHYKDDANGEEGDEDWGWGNGTSNRQGR